MFEHELISEIEILANGDHCRNENGPRNDPIRVNFIDILQRCGDPGQEKPYHLGLKAEGKRLIVSDDIINLNGDDRVGYDGGPTKAYSEARLLPAAHDVRLPRKIDAGGGPCAGML